jgi:hypothetical protein
LAQETAGIELSAQGIKLISQANALFLVDRVFRRLKAAKKLKYLGQVEATTGIVRALRHSIFALRMAGWRSRGRWNISKQNSSSFCPRRMRRGSRTNKVERLKHHLEKGRLKLVAREIYAVVPPDVGPAQFHPDPFLTAVAARADAVFSHHSALELLGAAHSVWNQVTLYTGRRRRSLRLNGSILRFMEHPGAMRSISSRDFGTRRVERRGKILTATGPERTLVEGFRRPALAGGLEELVLSAGGFSTIDLNLLEEVLNRYDIANLWAATGWFLERF